MEKITRVMPILLITIFLTSMLIVPSALIIGSFDGNANMMNFNGEPESQASISQISHNARVAIYDEANLTVPAISEAALGSLTNNLTEIKTLLEDAGHSVDLLTEEDILDHQLLTADYDIFVIVNNVPRPSIFNHIKEFSLGGGGLLTFENAVSYLWFGGFIDETSTQDEGLSHYWGYYESSGQNVTTRHSTMKDFHEGDNVTLELKDRVTHWGPELTTQRGNDMILLMNNSITPNYITAFAIDNMKDGGRIVQLPGDGYDIASDMEGIILDSVGWLVPRPKGRIAFDLSHSPRIGVDIWDWDYISVWSSTNNFHDFRSLAANHTYTFDKLYPSATGNLTADRLADYDVLVIAWPDLDYTSAERAAVETWVAGGGSLLVLGDRTGLSSSGGTGDVFINQLLQNFDMSLGTTDVINFATMSPATHVTLERCTGLYIGYRNYLSVIGNATEIWMDGTDCVVAGQEFGLGRAILSADMNIFDETQLGEASNTAFALNVLNWLTAADAEVLVFTDYGFSYYHRDPVSLAMLDLGIPFQLFSTSEYIDDFLDSKSWELFILNEVNYALTGLELDEIYAYVNTGGRLFMSYYDMDGHPTHPLWSKLGVEHSTTLSGSPTINIWDTTHDMFNTPTNHSEVTYLSGGIIADDGDTVTHFEGYSALAGTTTTLTNGSAVIVASDDRQTLYNSFLIDNFDGDVDDSTYADRVELWQNQITFMLTEPVTTTGGGLPFDLDTNTMIIIGVGILALILIIVLVRRRK